MYYYTHGQILIIPHYSLSKPDKVKALLNYITATDLEEPQRFK